MSPPATSPTPPQDAKQRTASPFPLSGRTILLLSRLIAALLCLMVCLTPPLLIRLWRLDRPLTTDREAPLRLTFAQMELTPSPAPLAELKREPEPEPEPQPEPEPEPPEDLPDPPDEPPPEEIPPHAQEAIAQIEQEAAAPEAPFSEPDALQRWVAELLEQEKHYPPSAIRAGYEGRFLLQIVIGADGRIKRAQQTGGRGHRILRVALDEMLDSLNGRRYPGHPPTEQVEFPFEFEFKLE